MKYIPSCVFVVLKILVITELRVLAMSKWLALSLVIILLDQVTKYFASHILSMYQPIPIVPGFNLTLMHNTGAAFSFLSQAGGWQRWFFIGIASVVSIVIIVWMNGLPKNKSKKCRPNQTKKRYPVLKIERPLPQKIIQYCFSRRAINTKTMPTIIP